MDAAGPAAAGGDLVSGRALTDANPRNISRGRHHPRLRWVPVAAVLLLAACGTGERAAELRVGATTTIEDSGLLQVIDSAFEATHPQHALRVVTGGTGEILEIARRGDLDVTWTHDPIAEAQFVAAGDGVERIEVMYNEFVIAGPPADPAHIAGKADAAAALVAILNARTRFISRGDESGTHRREQQLWREVGIEPDTLRRNESYVTAGLGMGDALRVASELGAYILTDGATLARLGPTLELETLVQGDPRLINRYAVMVSSVTPRPVAADSFVNFLLTQGAAIISNFGTETGSPLFRTGRAPIE